MNLCFSSRRSLSDGTTHCLLIITFDIVRSSVAKQYDMIDDTNIDPEEKLPLTVRSVHLIDPKV